MPLPESICVIMSPRELRANRIVLMLKTLARQGVKLDIHLCTCSALSADEDYQTTKGYLPHRLHIGRGVYSIPLIGVFLFLFWGIFWQTRDHIKRREMVMLGHYTNLPVALWCKLFYRKRVWYDVRDMMVYYVSPNYPAALGPLLGCWERLFMPWVDLVTSVDSAGGFWIKRYQAMGKATQVIYNVPSWEGLDAEVVARRIEARDLAGAIDIVIAGAITEHQGIEALLQGIALWGRPCRLHLVGMIHPGLARRLEALADQGETACAVVTHPWLTYTELVDTISHYHLGVMSKNPTSGQYGLLANGNARKVFTYMQAGLPVLSPRYRSVARLVDDEGVGMRVDVSDPADIAKGLRHILEDAQEYRAMARRGLELVRLRYNWELESQKLRDFLAS